MDHEVAQTVHGEAYRLADPWICIVCGDSSPFEAHLCDACPTADWGKRFTREVSSDEASEGILRLQRGMRLSLAGAIDCFKQLQHTLQDYTGTARDFFQALQAFMADPRCTGTSQGNCLRPPDLDDLNTGAAAIDWAWRQALLSCPLCRLHSCKVLLAFQEDKRHGLEPGATTKEVERRTRERRLAQRVAAVRDGSVESIVRSALDR